MTPRQPRLAAQSRGNLSVSGMTLGTINRMRYKASLLFAMLCASQSIPVHAQSVTELAVAKGLAPVTVLSKTAEGNAALAANYTVTGGIQTGAIRQATLLPFAEQQQQALEDVSITSGNLAQLADGLGTTLGAGYLARAHYIDRTRFTRVSQSVTDIIAYALMTTWTDAGSAKYFFANGTTDGKTPASAEAQAILTGVSGETDFYGKSYRLTAGSPGADVYGNSRPFQTEPSLPPITGPDYFNTPASNRVYNQGPLMNLADSPSFPSGHSTYGYTGAVLLAVLVPSRYPQMITRAAEYGNDRILVGAHYAMDVIGGRTLALYDMAHLLANDPAYMGRPVKNGQTVRDFRAAIKAAQADLVAALQAACGKSIQECSEEDIGRLSNPAVNHAFYAETLTYDLPVVYSKNSGQLEDVGKLAPEAGYLLTVAFPALSLAQADEILTQTEGAGGGFLDDGSSFGVYSRLDLYAASMRAAAQVHDRHQ
jgi:PAP2 superfamily protein